MCLDGKGIEQVCVGLMTILSRTQTMNIAHVRNENRRKIIHHERVQKRKRLSLKKERESVLYPSPTHQRVRIPPDKGMGLFWTCIYGNNCLRTWMLCALLRSDSEIQNKIYFLCLPWRSRRRHYVFGFSVRTSVLIGVTTHVECLLVIMMS